MSLHFLCSFPCSVHSAPSNTNHNGLNPLDRISSPSNKLKCCWCATPFDDIESLEKHQKRLHTKKCHECSLSFRTKSELEDHVLSAHDPYADGVDTQTQTVRIADDGTFQLCGDQSLRRWIHSKSHQRQKARFEYQLRQKTKTIEVGFQEESGSAIKRRRGSAINCQSFLKRKRSNLGRNKKWTPKETKRFYKFLRFSGLNFVFLEALYNRTVSMKDVKKEEPQNGDHELKPNSDFGSDSDSDSDFDPQSGSVSKEKRGKGRRSKKGKDIEKKQKQKKMENGGIWWHYRDAKQVRLLQMNG